MKHAASLIMLLAVLAALLAPVHIAPVRAGGPESIMTLNVCDTSDSGSVSQGNALYIPQDMLYAARPFSLLLLQQEEAIAICPAFSAGPDRPPRA